MMKFRKAILLAMAMLITWIPFGNVAGATDADMVFYIGSNKAVVSGSQVQLDDGNEEVTAQLRQNRAFLPVRFVAQNLGLGVQWNEELGKVTLSGGGKQISFVIGSDIMEIDGVQKQLDAQPFLYNDRTYLPLRAIGESFGKQVYYDRGLIIIHDGSKAYKAESDTVLINQYIDTLSMVPVVGSMEKLASLFPNAPDADAMGGDGRMYLKGSTAGAASGAAAPVQSVAVADEAQQSDGNYSSTNVQEKGVDEADIIKTDGEYIYRISGGKLYIVDAQPEGSMKVLATYSPNMEGFWIRDMYVDGDMLILMGQGYRFLPQVKDSANTTVEPTTPQAKMAPARPGIMPIHSGYNASIAMVLDISNREKPTLIRSVETDGSYLTSRKIGSSIYMVSNEYFYYFKNAKPEEVIPYYKDSAAMKDYMPIELQKVRYIPGGDYSSYAVVTGFDIQNTKQSAQVSAYLGAGNNVYVSQKNMYITSQRYEPQEQESVPIGVVAQDAQIEDISAAQDPYKAVIYKFSLQNGNVQFLARGSVPGQVLNQFSMDEQNEHFRIATTSTYYRTSQTSSNVFVLDAALQKVGSIEKLAPGERIYSVRYMQDRAYVVTFRQVDPLFVIDLKDPQKPAILGQLKIPGFSNYLHPYDENHIIGFGKDATNEGIMQGLKMAIFDVTDVANPKELHKEAIGDRGSDSSLLYDHKALMFSPEKGILALPVTVYEADNADKNAYGKFAFQGAYIYNISIEKGFSLKGRITHLSKADYANGYGDGNKYVDRILYIGDTLFTSSPAYIMANDMHSLAQKGLVELK